MKTYKYKGAEAMVELHANEMRAFLEVWQKAHAANFSVPASEDPDYQSLEHILCHVLGASKGYIIWICEQLELEASTIGARPTPQSVVTEAEAYLSQVLQAWDGPLVDLTEKQAHAKEYPSKWKTKYCIDAMLEHAVMHPLRHRFQIENWLRP